MVSKRQPGVLPEYIHDLAERGRARKIINELNQPNLITSKREGLQTELDELEREILVVLADAPDQRQDKAIALLSEAKKVLSVSPTEKEILVAKKKIVHADQIAKRWESEKQQAEQVFWVGLILSFIISIFSIIYILTFNNSKSNQVIVPILDVPPSAVLWGGIGGIAAVIRSIMKPDQISPAFRHLRILLVTRPVYGMIAGCVLYLLVVSGLTAFAYTTQVSVGQENANRALLWAMSFAGGFYAPFLDKLLFSVSNQKIEENDVDFQPNL